MQVMETVSVYCEMNVQAKAIYEAKCNRCNVKVGDQYGYNWSVQERQFYLVRKS
jgi:hypothetical protein